jgi:hypothetical protein
VPADCPRPEHAHQALGRDIRGRAQAVEADRRVDVAQNRLAGIKIPRKQALDPFAQQLD